MAAQGRSRPSWIDGEGVTPLILAAFKNHPEIVNFLLAQKRSVRAVHADQWGRTARDYAKQRGTNDPIFSCSLNREAP